MEEFAQLFQGIVQFQWQYLIMYAIGSVLIFLAIKKDYEPMLLLPIGFGAILVNLPLSTIWEFDGSPGVLQIFYNSGILTEIFPVLIFVAVGAMIDFSPLLKNPKMLFFGAAAQFGIFFTALGALYLNVLFPELGFDLKTSAAIGIIGAADGPTSIFVASKFAKEWIGPISVAAYSYMALVPVIQPPVVKLLTTKKERLIRMNFQDVKVSRTVLIAFPILIDRKSVV